MESSVVKISKRASLVVPLAIVGLVFMVLVAGCSEKKREHERVDLDAYEKTVTSQFGEDGVLEQIFGMINHLRELPPSLGLCTRASSCECRQLAQNFL